MVLSFIVFIVLPDKGREKLNYNDKPRAYFNLLFAFDCETSAINFDNKLNPAKGCQAVSWGIMVLNANTLETLEELYLEVKWNGESEWSMDAEKVHGLSKEYLEENGMDEQDALVEIANLIGKYWAGDTMVNTLGHNSISFDLPFLFDLYDKHGLKLKFSYRNIDTNTLGFTLLRTYNSDDLFTSLALPERKIHNALEDIRYTVECVRRIRILWDAKVGIKGKYL